MSRPGHRLRLKGGKRRKSNDRAAIVSAKVTDLGRVSKSFQTATVGYATLDRTTRTLRHRKLETRVRFGRFEIGDRVNVAYVSEPDGGANARIVDFGQRFGWAYSLFAIGLLFLFLQLGFGPGKDWMQYRYPFTQAADK